MRRAPTIASCAASALVMLAGCGSSTTVVTDTSGSQSAQTSAVSTPATGGAPPSSSATTPAAGPAPSGAGRPLCTAGRLKLSVLGQQGATGHGELGLALTNSGAVACHTFGFPGVLFLSPGGAALPTNTLRVTHDFFGTAPATALILTPGQRASFRLGVTHGQASSAGCVTAASVQVIPPDDTHALRASVPSGVYECGTATVSPLQPGTSAFG